MERPSTEPAWRVIAFDVAPVIVFLLMGLWDVFAQLSAPFGDGAPASSVGPVIVACLALALRRRRPMLTLGLVMAALVIPGFFMPVRLTFWGEYVVWLVAQYSVGRHAPGRRGWLALPLSWAVYGLALARYPNMREPDTTLVNLAVLVVVWVIGRLTASWTDYRERTTRLELERARAEERAAGRERARIAREVHDVLSHTVTVMVMQAGGARFTAGEDPDAATRALATIEDLGRDALGELRALLEVLRAGDDRDDDSATAPQPSIADVEALCTRMRALGLPVRLRMGSDLDGIPAALQLTAYRVAQEGLTNVLKHAGAVATDVAVERRDPGGDVTVEVACAAGDGNGTLPGAEQGLKGLRERVAAFGGSLTTSTRPDGGFVLRARLPVEVTAR